MEKKKLSKVLGIAALSCLILFFVLLFSFTLNLSDTVANVFLEMDMFSLVLSFLTSLFAIICNRKNVLSWIVLVLDVIIMIALGYFFMNLDLP